MPKLDQRAVDRIKPGNYTVGDNLNLIVRSNGYKKYQVRFSVHGKVLTKIIGRADSIKLREALAITTEFRRKIDKGGNPFVDEHVPSAPIFREVAEEYIAEHEESWADKTTAHWKSTLKTFAYDVIGDKPTDQITKEDVFAILKPIWADMYPTAKKVRQRIEAVIDASTFKGAEIEHNPAVWRGNLDKAGLPKRSTPEEHHRSIHWSEAPAIISDLKKRQGDSARALIWVILTGSRVGNVTNMQFSQVDFQNRIWTTPVFEMKIKENVRDHRVPLTKKMLKFIGGSARPNDFVFKNPSGDQMSSAAIINLLKRMGLHDNTVTHGFRTTVTDYFREGSKQVYPEAAIQGMIAHKQAHGAFSAYARGDLLETRRKMIKDWQRFLGL